jgi:hypothetical protein
MEGAKTQLFGSWGGHLTTFSRMKIDEAFFFFLTCLHNYGRSKRAFEEEKYVF